MPSLHEAAVKNESCLHLSEVRGLNWRTPRRRRYRNELPKDMAEWSTQNLRRDGSSFTWHLPCGTQNERCQYTTSVDIKNTRYKKGYSQTLIRNHMRHVRSESAREQRIACLFFFIFFIKAMNNNGISMLSCEGGERAGDANEVKWQTGRTDGILWWLAWAPVSQHFPVQRSSVQHAVYA